MQYCSLQHQTLLPSPVTSTTGWWCCFVSILSFFLELFLHWSPVAYWEPTNLGVHLSVSYLFAFSYCSWGSQGKNTEVVCHSLLQWIVFCQNSPPWPLLLGWLYMAWLSFIELDKNVVHVFRLVSFLWFWFQSVCSLMPSPSAYRFTGVLRMSIAAASQGNNFPLLGSFMFAFILKRNRIFFLKSLKCRKFPPGPQFYSL